MSPIEAAQAAAHWSIRWWDRCIVKGRRIKRVVTALIALGTIAGVMTGGWSLSVDAWRAVGAPVLATEGYVDSRMVSIAKAINDLDSRTLESQIEGAENHKAWITSELVKYRQITLSSIADPLARTAIETQIANLSADQIRIQNKLDSLRKLRN